ncbi:MAG: hypothetical protein Q7J47_22830 [Azoarcus sp.]|nr:hypothetical protein [Azoarcus sp.]
MSLTPFSMLFHGWLGAIGLTSAGTATAFPLRLRLHYKAARAAGVMPERSDPLDLFDQSPEEIHEALGNDTEQWLLRADALHRSGEFLYERIQEPPTNGADVLEVWSWFSIHDVGRMLRGMAFECLLKAMWLARGEVLVKDGRFIGIPGTKGHDLYAMYVNVVLNHRSALSEEEKKLLARLSFAIVSARYPVSKSPRGNYPSAPTSRNKMQWNKCEHEKDSALFELLWGKLSKILQEYRNEA